jgi:ABC-2 type transport system ATP-binding protein
VAVEGLTICYDDRAVVDDLSFVARPGEVLALLGPNGAGKTSTIEALEGYRRPASGRVRVLGLDPVADRARLVPHIGVMLQDGGVATGMRVAEAAHLYAAYYDDPLEPDGLLERLGLDAVRRTTWRHLSGGERQRLSLALALIGRPRVAFLDEPTAGVDVQGRAIIRAVVRELRDEGVTVVLASHELDEVERMADRIAIVDGGRLLACGTLAELTAGDGHSIRFDGPSGLDTAALGQMLGAAVKAEPDGGRTAYRVDAEGTPATIAALTGWLAEHDVAIDGLRTGGASLEEVFLRMTAVDASRVEEQA